MSILKRSHTGDYKIGETLLLESATAIVFSAAAPPPAEVPSDVSSGHLSLSNLPSLSSVFARSRTPSPEPSLTPLTPPPMPRRIVLVVLGLKPHRLLWTTSARPSESVIYYNLLNGCPAVVLPVKTGAPLVAWDTLTLEELWKVEIPEDENGATSTSKFEGIISVLSEYLEMCVDWGRVCVPKFETPQKKVDGTVDKQQERLESDDEKRTELKSALRLLVSGAIRSGQSRAVRSEVDKERSGIAMWRIL